MTEHNLEVGERVGVWSRPADDVIYMFGYGRFIGSANINGTTFPAVTFDLEPGQEYVLRYSNIWYGRHDSIQSTLSEFEGKIYKMTLTQFLAEDFKPPERQGQKEGVSTKDATPKPPRDETAFDIMYRLGSEVKKALSRVQVFEMSIVELQTSIKEKRTKMAALKSQALSDLDAIERGETIAPSKPKEPVQPVHPEPEPVELCSIEQPATLISNACEVCEGVPGACACT